MESVGSCEYDPDDLDLEETPARMENNTMGQGLSMAPLIRLSTTLDLKETWTRTELSVG